MSDVHSGHMALRGVLGRIAASWVLWAVMIGTKPIDLLIGAVVAVITGVVSMRLSPPGAGRMSPFAAASMAFRFLRQSIVAGFDVARRALDPRLPIRPGFVLYESRLPPGPAREAFCTMTSLLPGTLPCGPRGERAIEIHCLDTRDPVPQQLAVEEAHFVRAFLNGGKP